MYYAENTSHLKDLIKMKKKYQKTAFLISLKDGEEGQVLKKSSRRANKC